MNDLQPKSVWPELWLSKLGLRSLREPSEETHAALLSRRITLSLATSVVSKVVSTILQLVAFPLAINALGTDRFGVYVSLAATLNWINMAGIGIGPGLTLGTVSSMAAGDRKSEARMFTTAFALMLMLTVATLVILALAVSILGIQAIFGDKLGLYQAEIRQGMVVLGLLIGANLVLSIVEASQAGHQNQYLNYLWTIFGNIMTIGMLLVVAAYWRSITGMIIAVYGARTIAKLFNGGQLLWRHHYLVPQWNELDKRLARMLVSIGLAFLLGQFASFLNQQFTVFWVGRQLGPGSAAGFAVMIQMLSLAGSFVVMVTVPLWPAIADAKIRGDWLWIGTIYKKTVLGLMSYAALAGSAIALGGNWLVRHWIGPQVAPSSLLQMLIGVYFVLVVWENTNFTVLIGLGKIRQASVVFVSGSMLTVIAGVYLVNTMGNSGMALALCLGPICLTSWLFPLMIKRSLLSASSS